MYKRQIENGGTLSDPNIENPVVSASQNGEFVFTLVVTDENGCTSNAGTFTLIVNAPCNLDLIEIPNVFTPDNDGINDDFGIPEPEGVFDIKEMRVYNRWGNLVFESEGNPNPRWDGRDNDRIAPNDVYVYFIRVGCVIDPNRPDELLSGDVTLIR